MGDAAKCDRRLVPVTSWGCIETLETREREIEMLLDGGFLHVDAQSRWPKVSSRAERMKLRDVLKRALYQCDAIADVETDVILLLRHESHKGLNKDLEMVSAENQLVREKQLIMAGATFAPRCSKVVRRALVRWGARRSQADHVRALGDDDLCGIVALLHVAAQSLHASRFSPLAVPPAAWAEEATAFREAIARHGSWFLYAHVRGYFQRGRHGQGLLRLALADLRRFEGEPGAGGTVAAPPPGLHMTLLRELRTRLGVEAGASVETRALLRVDEMVRGRQAERPVTFLFANPPSEED